MSNLEENEWFLFNKIKNINMNFVVQGVLSKFLGKYLKNFSVDILIIKGEGTVKNL